MMLWQHVIRGNVPDNLLETCHFILVGTSWGAIPACLRFAVVPLLSSCVSALVAFVNEVVLPSSVALGVEQGKQFYPCGATNHDFGLQLLPSTFA